MRVWVHVERGPAFRRHTHGEVDTHTDTVRVHRRRDSGSTQSGSGAVGSSHVSHAERTGGLQRGLRKRMRLVERKREERKTNI